MADNITDLLQSDWGIDELLRRAKSEPAAAAELLQIAALYLQRGVAMPKALADHLAHALTKAADAAQEDRRGVLATELHLVRPANPPVKVRPVEILTVVVLHDYRNHVRTDKKPRLEKQLVADLVSEHGISEKKARDLIKAAREQYRAEW